MPAEAVIDDKPANVQADELEAAMQAKLSALLTPTQDGVKVPEVATSAQSGNVPSALVPAPAPQPAVVAPAPAPDPAIPVTDLPPEGASKASKEHWERFRALKNAEIEKRDKELGDIRKELEKLKAGRAIDPLEYEATKKAKDDLEATVERLRLEESPKFKAYYDGGVEKQLKLVKAVAGLLGDEAVKLIQSPRSKERNERLREIQEELGPEGNIIGNALGEITRLQHERGEQLANGRENSRRLREVEQREQEAVTAQAIEQRKAVADRLVARAREIPEFKPVNGDKDHVAFTDNALIFIRNAVEGKLASEDALLLPVAAMKLQYLETLRLPKLTAELEGLKTRVAELTGARPQVNGQQQRQGGQPAQPQHDPDDPYGVGAMTKQFNELLGRSG